MRLAGRASRSSWAGLMTVTFVGLQVVGAVELDLDDERMCNQVSRTL